MHSSHQVLGHALLRATVGLNFLMHGAARISVFVLVFLARHGGYAIGARRKQS